jgi:XTP/dITP diphosphohydrolase
MSEILVFATNNLHKLKEIRNIVPAGFEVLGLKDIGCTQDIPETADTLEGNADIKAYFVYQNYSRNCFADDTGLEVDALDGKPGVYSARYAGEDGNADKNIIKLLREMLGVEERSARFRTVISMIMNDDIRHFEGIVEGKILHERRGAEGFGYDPVFFLPDRGLTVAELTDEEKDAISHRGRAVDKLKSFLRERL